MGTKITPRGGSPVLAGLADAVLQPGFVGATLPDWVRRRLAEGLGGVTLYAGNLLDSGQAAALIRQIRAENPHAVIAVDEEAGDVTRLEAYGGSTRPGNLALGAADDPALTEAVARGVGGDLAELGFTLTYAPAVDVDSDLDNPVIGTRAFGSDPELVARHAAAWVRGLQSTGVAACAKHFPGHGATAVDSHDELPVVTWPADDLAATALPPFRAAVEAGVRAVMTGHLLVPAYDAGSPATTSRAVVELLRGDLGFDGLIVTDGIEMPAVSRRHGLGRTAVLALAAGADAVCVGGESRSPGVVGLLRNTIMAAVMDGTLPEERLAEAAARVRRLTDWSAAAKADSARANAAEPSTVATSITGANAAGASPVQASTTGTSAAGMSPGQAAVAAARRALRVTVRRSPAVSGPPHVIELDTPTNLAVDPNTPWGLAAPLARLMPGTTVTRLTGPDPVDPAPDRPVVVAIRTAYRHAWAAQAVDRILARRPDAVVVEMGVPGLDCPGAVTVATFGGTALCAQVAAEAIAALLDP
ncbi:glycoside hydrolase family 3 protein [Thermoactinospora rubra]|uniref:glycoside hydrolase family 3 protein n=1 Tax=Thermoactinospora rubra TaxID=1088767 RepID=UPI00117EDACB|nr:glycoside hydrolase family 3 N-terminal domain-containing protein [Thermoactinospora rubra]